MRVLIPIKRERHPYLRLLCTHIENYGIKVLHTRSIWSFDFLKYACFAQVIHLHWIEFIVRSKNLIAESLKFWAACLIFLCLKIVKKRIVVSLHNIQPHEKVHPKLEEVWFRIVIKIADKIIVHNYYSHKVLKNYYGITDKVYIIPHGNFVGFYPNKVDRETARKKLSIPEDAFVMLYFGLIRDYKGINDLLTVLRELLPIYSQLFPVICGKSEGKRLHKEIMKFSEEFVGRCIVRLEYIPDEEVQFYMNAADVGVLPYKEITTSGTVILFQSFAKTVIVPKISPIKEILGDYGIYFQPNNKESLKSSMIKAINFGSYQLQSLGRKAYEKILKVDWDSIAKLTLKAYAE